MVTNKLLNLRNNLTNVLSSGTKSPCLESLQNLLKEINASISYISKDPDKKFLAIEICAQINKISLLESRRYSVVGNLKASRHLYSILVSRDPENVTYLQEYCDYLIWENKCKVALEILLRIISKNLTPLQLNRVLYSLYEVNILMGQCSDAMKWLSLMPNTPSVNYGKAMAYIQKGDITQGLVEYKKYLDVIPTRFSNIPKWDGKHLEYRAVLFTLTDSCGGGDELAFSRYLEGIEDILNVYIESEPRCKKLYQLSFPGSYVFNFDEQAPWEKNKLYIEPQVQISTRSLFVKNVLDDPTLLESCENLKCSRPLVEKFKSQTNDFAGGKYKLGLGWRSYHVLGPTARESIDLEELKQFQILKEEVAFFNFQYDLTSEDVSFFEEKIGINIYNPDFDQLNDFQQVGAYALSLDLIFSAMNTNSAIANSVGANVIEVRPEFMPSCLLILPMFQNRKSVLRSWNEPWKNTIKKTVQLIKKEIQKSGRTSM